MAPRETTRTPQERAQRQAQYLAGLVWHAGTFVIVNAFFWVLDGVTGLAGFQWAFWVTLFWGLALAFHALAYVVDGRQLEARTAGRLLDDERREHPPGAAGPGGRAGL